MDMQKYNDDIKNADDVVKDDGPRFPDGDYVLVVTGYEEKNKFPIPNTDPLDYEQTGLWITFLICEGEKKGKEHMEYANLKHPESKICTRYGRSFLKNLYRASLGAIPRKFEAVFGKRFIGTLKSTEKNDPDNPWSTKIVKFAKAPDDEMEKFEDVPPVETVSPAEIKKLQEEIDSIPF